MKRFILLVAILATMFRAAKAQDSCYVYTQLHWAPAMTKYVAQIQLNDKGDDEYILDENGNKLSFGSILHAMNYLSLQGWELVQLSSVNPRNQTSALKEQYALIRKKMSVEEARKYATPKEK